MEDDGATGARSRDDRAAQAGPVRPARRGRLGVGRGQGLRLADHHHPVARVHPRPRLLPHGQPDGGSGRPRLVPDQPLPARERDPAVPGAGRRGHALARVADRAGPARRRGPMAPPRSSGPRSCTSAGSDGTAAQSTVFVAPTSGIGNFDKWTEGPPLPEPRSDASVVQVSGTVYVIGGFDADGAPTTTVYHADARPADRRPRRVGDRARGADAARGARRGGRRRGTGRTAAHRRRGTRWPGGDDLEEPFQRPGRPAEVGSGGPAPGSAGRRDRRDHRRPRVAVRRA